MESALADKVSPDGVAPIEDLAVGSLASTVSARHSLEKMDFE
jgi:hypothetical protein